MKNQKTLKPAKEAKLVLKLVDKDNKGKVKVVKVRGKVVKGKGKVVKGKGKGKVKGRVRVKVKGRGMKKNQKI
jgi:hypothetical protein